MWVLLILKVKTRHYFLCVWNKCDQSVESSISHTQTCTREMSKEWVKTDLHGLEIQTHMHRHTQTYTPHRHMHICTPTHTYIKMHNTWQTLTAEGGRVWVLAGCRGGGGGGATGTGRKDPGAGGGLVGLKESGLEDIWTLFCMLLRDICTKWLWGSAAVDEAEVGDIWT